ncbi:EipB family protein [Candidatus Paracaedibacter symbiosus]|uniref:EipB family protein n=1 Tax=Candidatus Paracaedibacter symbiosus TaxID=244582 RepID=UPI0018DB1564|nr:DUF1849 family protein [Candidatus Paracaedibacter symbiosus]
MSVAVQANNGEGYLSSIKKFFNQYLQVNSSPVNSSKEKIAGMTFPAQNKPKNDAIPQNSGDSQSKEKTVPQNPAAIILPHIATYKISLDKGSVNDDIDDANGFMTIKIFDTGDGWVFEQNSSLIIYSTSGEGEQVNTNVATWQDYAGNHYRFNSRTLRNGQEEDVIRGEAHKGAEKAPGKVIYHLPNYAEMDIPHETIFPLHHLINAVQKAMLGNSVVSNIVFDGSAETQEAVAVNTVITPAKESKLNIISDKPLPADLNKVWSMKLGVYPLNSKSPDPDYEIKQDVLNHGIIKNMTLDYGTFQVIATLDKIEFFTSN